MPKRFTRLMLLYLDVQVQPRPHGRQQRLPVPQRVEHVRDHGFDSVPQPVCQRAGGLVVVGVGAVGCGGDGWCQL